MSIMFILLAAGATVAATIITASRIVSWRWMAKYATLIDVLFTVLLLIVFAGTLTGMLIAVLAGLFMAIVLTALRCLTRLDTNVFSFDRLQWPIKQHPAWSNPQ